MPQHKQNVSATLDGALLRKLDLIARETERNRSWLIGKALESYLEDLDDLHIAQERRQEARLSPVQLRKALGL